MPNQSPSSAVLIVADIGGTNARFALVPKQDAPLAAFKSYKTEGFKRFEDVLETYLSELGAQKADRLAVGAAGPVEHGTIKLTNLAWTVDPKTIKQRLKLETPVLANDLVAMAAGIARAGKDAFETLPGRKADDTQRTLVIAIGTGLGVAWYERGNGDVTVHSTEAGHMLYSPTDQVGLKLVERCLGEEAAISFENVVSGSGIRRVYAKLRGASDPELKASEAIVVGAERGDNAAAHATLDLVLRAVAVFARDLALVLGGVDEIVLAGGLGRRLRSHFAADAFLGRLRDSRGVPLDFSEIGVRVAIDDELPLHGAAHLAFGSVRSGQVVRKSKAQ